jgi:DNA (cytosine-5)-methyltransferase 1
VNYLDLFSGIGGFALGAYWAGWRFDRHYFSEIDPWCCNLYQRRFPDAVPLGDIREINGKALASSLGAERLPIRSGRSHETKVDADRSRSSWIITGGFPCQDISVAGKGAGIEGLRSGLWFEYARLIGEIRPRYAIMENVGALTRRGLDRVLGSLAEIGYDAEWSDIRASDIGAPHRRERIWIVAYPCDSGQRELLQSVRQSERILAANPGSYGQVQSVAHSISGREREHSNGGRESGQAGHAIESSWWAVEPDVGRVAHGVPRRVDRLRGLGNAIVPQIAERIFRGLKDI